MTPDEQQAQVDALPGTWRRQKPLGIGADNVWRCPVGAGTAFLVYSRHWFAEYRTDPMDEDTVQANGPAAAEALHALVREVRSVAAALADDSAAHVRAAAEIERLLSGQEVER